MLISVSILADYKRRRFNSISNVFKDFAQESVVHWVVNLASQRNGYGCEIFLGI